MVSSHKQADRPCRGGIYLDPHFRYRNGNVTTKYVIILNKLPFDGFPLVSVPVTSNPPKPNLSVGCNPLASTFFFQANSYFFPKDTFVQLHEYVPYIYSEFCSRLQEGIILHQYTLDAKILKAVLDCFQHQQKDVDEEIYDLVI
jgi:hypothetical protein